MNRGYAAMWIGEILAQKGEPKAAYAFFRSAIYIWTKRSPLLAGQPMEKLAMIRDSVDENWAAMSNSAVDKYCRDWISNWLPSHKHR